MGASDDSKDVVIPEVPGRLYLVCIHCSRVAIVASESYLNIETVLPEVRGSRFSVMSVSCTRCRREVVMDAKYMDEYSGSLVSMMFAIDKVCISTSVIEDSSTYAYARRLHKQCDIVRNERGFMAHMSAQHVYNTLDERFTVASLQDQEECAMVAGFF